MKNTQIENRFVAVLGEAEVKTSPDEVVVAFGVETVDKDISQAKKDNDDIVKSMITLAKEQGINSDHIQTDYLDIEPKHTRFEYKYEFLGYYVRKSIVITLKDIAQLENILTDALEIGVNYVHEISFQTTKLKKFRNEARSLAIKAAQAKAEALSRELNLKVGKPLSIEEETSGVRSGNISWWGSGYHDRSQTMVIRRDGSDLDSGESIAPGQIAVKARVKVKFEIE